VAGHRDTHFAFLRQLAIGSEIVAENAAGERERYRVVKRFVTDERDQSVLADVPRGHRLTLVTCWPFDPLVFGGPQRLVVVAVGEDELAKPPPTWVRGRRGEPRDRRGI
jgi:sortase A